MRATLLRGREQTQVGALETAGTGRVAAAISRGGAAKTYPYVHPNEDAALVAEGRRGLLVAVADGHWGCEAAEAAVGCLLLTVCGQWTDDVTGGDSWEETAARALEEVARVVLELRHVEGRRSPRTTLGLALARPQEDRLVIAAVGDSHVFRVAGGGEVEDLAAGSGRVRYLGARARSGDPLPTEPWIRVVPLAGTRAVVAVTDGLSEAGIGVEDPAAAVAEAVKQATAVEPAARAAEAARAVVQAALAAHRAHDAGDNVAAAVAWLEAEQASSAGPRARPGAPPRARRWLGQR